MRDKVAYFQGRSMYDLALKMDNWLEANTGYEVGITQFGTYTERVQNPPVNCTNITIPDVLVVFKPVTKGAYYD